MTDTEFTYKGIETFEYDDDPPFYGFESVKDKLVMSGDIRSDGKLFKLNFFLAKKGLPKGQARKTLCEFIEKLLKKKMITPDYTFYLEADPNYGAGLSDRKTSMEGLLSMYKSMTFKVAGTKKFGNIPMTTTIGKFMEWCKTHNKAPPKTTAKPKAKPAEAPKPATKVIKVKKTSKEDIQKKYYKMGVFDDPRKKKRK